MAMKHRDIQDNYDDLYQSTSKVSKGVKGNKLSSTKRDPSINGGRRTRKTVIMNEFCNNQQAMRQQALPP